MKSSNQFIGRTISNRIGDDLTVLLGEGDDLLTISGIEVLDNAILDGESGADTFYDDGDNLLGSQPLVDFELCRFLGIYDEASHSASLGCFFSIDQWRIWSKTHE